MDDVLPRVEFERADARDQIRGDARFLARLAQRGFVRRLTALDVSLGQDPLLRVASRFDQQDAR